jgi:type I restriction enzyme S subunit
VSRIDNLVRRFSPNAVEFTTLGQVVSNLDSQRRPVTRSARRAGEFPYYGANGIQDHVDDYLFDGTFLLVGEDGSVVQRDGSPVVNWASGKIWVNNHAHVLTARTETVELRYLYFYLQTVDVTPYVTGSTQPKLNQANLNRIPVAVPPIELQREIVSVLDLYGDYESELENELQAEADARRRQYAYYRDSLLSFESTGVKRIALGEIARIVRGASPRPIRVFITDAEDGVPWIKIGDVAAGGKYIISTAERVTPEGAAKSRRVYPGDFVLSNSMSFGRPYISKIEGCIHDGWLAISDFDESFEPDFLYHLLRSAPVQAEFTRRAGAGAVQNLNADIVKSVAVPVPSLDEQKRIVSVLDKFEMLINDISVDLPAELNARRKQYEYYRDRLLSFEELVA